MPGRQVEILRLPCSEKVRAREGTTLAGCPETLPDRAPLRGTRTECPEASLLEARIPRRVQQDRSPRASLQPARPDPPLASPSGARARWPPPRDPSRARFGRARRPPRTAAAGPTPTTGACGLSAEVVPARRAAVPPRTAPELSPPSRTGSRRRRARRRRATPPGPRRRAPRARRRLPRAFRSRASDAPCANLLLESARKRSRTIQRP